MHKIQKILLVIFTSYIELIMSFHFQMIEIGLEVSKLRNKSRLQRNLRNNSTFKTEFSNNQVKNKNVYRINIVIQ